MLTKELLSEYIDAGAAKRKADMAILGGTLINVNTSEYYQADVAIYKGKKAIFPTTSMSIRRKSMPPGSTWLRDSSTAIFM